MPKQKVDSANILERDVTLSKIYQKLEPNDQKLIKKCLNYKMPKGYLTQECLINIGFFSVATIKSLHLYSRDFRHCIEPFSQMFFAWFTENQPLYCVTDELAKALIQTEVLCKFDILKNIRFVFKQFLIAIPKSLISVPNKNKAQIDFLLITFLKTSEEDYLQKISISCIDTSGIFWTFNTQIEATGQVTPINKISVGNIPYSENIKSFEFQLLSLALNFLLFIESSGNVVLTDVLPSETIQECSKYKGFSKKADTPPPKYPRWIGKNYKVKSERLPTTESGETHASPRTHWRRGHWRCIEPGEGKQWKESKRLWIEPVLINAGID